MTSEFKPCPTCEGKMEYEDGTRTWLECSSCFMTMTKDDLREAEPVESPLRLERDALRARVAALEAERERLRRAVEIVREYDKRQRRSGSCPLCGIIDGDYGLAHSEHCPVGRALRVAEGEG